jgi:hypothetical protein
MLNLILLPFKPIGIALACIIAIVSIAARAEPDACAAKRAAVRTYSESVAGYLAGPNLDREAVLSLLRPYEHIACN